MYQGTNPSALRSRDEIVTAFLHLLEQIPLEAITIKQIMLETQLSRQTFYQIFSSKEEILEYYLDTLFQKFIDHSQTRTIHDLCEGAHVFFAFFDQYRPILCLMIRNGKSCIVQRKCREYLLNHQYIRYENPDIPFGNEHRYAITFMISGMVAMLEQWICESDMTETTPDQLADLICRIAKS